MKNRLLLAAFAFAAALAVLPIGARHAFAETVICKSDSDCSNGQTCQDIDAQGDGECKVTPGTIVLKNPINVSTVPEIVGNIMRAGINIVGALALLVFIYGGFIWLTSRGDSGKVAAGKEAMKWATIGLVVIFTSYGLVRFVFKAFTG